ncbi:MAG: helix-turn-helix domain-containing protein, partial [Pseudomonadota bacterium]
VERAMVMCKREVVRPEDLPQELCSAHSESSVWSGKDTCLETREREHIFSVLRQCKWNKFRAAQILGISRSTLYSKMKKHELLAPV